MENNTIEENNKVNEELSSKKNSSSDDLKKSPSQSEIRSITETKNSINEKLETDPKKIPVGGIQMPGFFTKSKSKEKCKSDTEDVEDSVLITEQQQKDKTNQSFLGSRLKFPAAAAALNPFRKTKSSKSDEEAQQPREINRTLFGHPVRLPKVSLPNIQLPLRFSKQTRPNPNENTEEGLSTDGILNSKNHSETDSKIEKENELKEIPLNEVPQTEKDLPENRTVAAILQYMQTYRLPISGILVFLLLLIVILAITLPGKPFPREAPIKDGKYVETVTGCGKVEGLIEDSAVAFRGIPYARPPIGDLRFKSAQPLNSLEYCWNGTFLAHNATSECLQIHSNGTVTGSEDCLTLDVITPYVRYDNPLPVVVLIGAESLIGGSPGKARPSARYARAKDVIFVRPNFRLGVFGFLALDILSSTNYPCTSGNYGLSDILEALHWVQLNIDHFGGDKNSVTVLGHRAGATLVTALTTMPKANKYFTRAWAASGSSIFPQKTLKESELANRKFLDIIQCYNVTCLRRMDALKLINSVEDVWRKPQPDLPGPNEDLTKIHEWLVLDGVILREHPATVWANDLLKVDLILGSTAHAGHSNKLHLKHRVWNVDLIKQELQNSVLSVRNLTNDVLKKYPRDYKGLSSIVSDIRIVCPLYAISTQMIKVPFYVVTQTRGELNISDVDSDIDAILGRYEPKTPEQRRYVSAMQNFFYHYVWHGKVENRDKIGQKILLVGQDVLPNATYSECAFWIKKDIVLSFAALD